MAGPNWIEQDFSRPYTGSAPSDDWNIGDPLKAAGARVLGMGADLGAIVRSIGEAGDEDEQASRAASAVGEFLQFTFGGLEDATLDSISPAAMEAMQAGVTDPQFFSLLSLTMKGASMAPDIAAAAIPAARFPGMLSAIAISASQGAVFTTGALVDDMYRYTDAMSDEELYEEVPLYRDLIDQGVDAQTARQEWNREFQGARPYIMAAVGGVTGALGVRGIAARQAGGVGGALAGNSLAGRVGAGVAEGAISEAIQSGTEIALMQDAEVQAGLRDELDTLAIAEGAIGGAVLGGAAGGALSAPGGGSSRDDVAPAQEMQPAEGSASSAPNQPGSATPVASTPAVDTPVASTPAVDTPVASTPAIQVVDGPADAAQTVALNAQSGAAQVQTPQPAVPVQPQAAIATPPVAEAPQTATPAPQPPMAPTDPVVETAPATPPVQTAPVQTAPVETAPVQTAPVETAPVTTPPVTPPVDTSPTQTDTGPRILHDPNAPDYAEQWGQQIQRNQQEPVEQQPRGRNRTREEQAQRQATNEGSALIAQRFTPQDGEAGIVSQRPRDVQAARPLILARAQAISDAAREAGLVVPQAFRRNTTDSYNPETLLVMEAQRLARMDRPSLADIRRFYNRDLDIRLGQVEQAVAERRAEGDMASRRVPNTDLGDVADVTPDTAPSPEALVIANQERRTEVEGVTRRGNQPNTSAEELPPGLQRVLDRSIAKESDTPAPVYGAAKSRAVVETRKTRVLTKKPDPKVRAKPQPKPGATPARDSKVTPKVRAIQDRIKSAREDTDTSPTPAQARAGNYRKGSVSINGMTVRIENPKGSTRRNADPRGPRWSVKMRNDYGYIEGTRGRDGEPIDVYLGEQHDAQYIYVVDQVDPRTLTFDEHKVMMGFGSYSQAVQAYRNGFSDGSGVQRMGDIRPMTQAEFKAWLDTDPMERAGISPEDVAEMQSYIIEEMLNPTVPTTTFADTPVIPDGYAYDPYSGRIAPVTATRNASEVMAELDGSTLPPAQRYISGQMRRMLSETVGDVPIHFVTRESMAHIVGPAHISESGNPPLGFFTSDGNQNAIFIRTDLMAAPEILRHTVIHEAVHAATLKNIRDNPEVRRNIETLMAYTHAELMDMPSDVQNVARYALTEPEEFVSEALSNPRLQDILMRIPAPAEVVSALNMNRKGVRTAWDALVVAIRRVLGLPANSHTMLEAALRVSEQAMKPQIRQNEGGSAFLIDGNLKPLQAALTDRVNSILRRPEMQPSSGRPWLLRLRPFDSMARAADRAFGGAERNPIRKIAKLVEAQRVLANKHYEKSTPLLQRTVELQKRYERVRGEDGQSVWENYTSLTIDETSSGVYADRPLADQKHITKKGLRDAWARKQHPELARRYNALPAELKAHRQEMLDYFKEQQRNLSMMLTKNRLVKLFDVQDPDAFAQRIYDDALTDADKAILGDAYDAIKAAGVLSKIDGPYIPLMRRGNWVMVARSPVTKPGNAREINPNEFEFKSSDEAEAFAAKQGGKPATRTVYVDPQTNETFGVDTDGTQVPLTANDLNAEARYRVVVQDKTVEMFNTESEARQRAAELARHGMVVDDVAPRRFDNYGAQAEALSPQINRLMQVLERRADARNFTPEQKDNMLSAFSEMSLQLMASTRIQTRSLPRKSVAGASKDVTQNIHDYAIAMGNHVAKLEVGPQMDAALLEASEAINENRNDGMNGARQSILNEVQQRVTQVDPRTNASGATPLINRILAVSFLDKLMSPSYSVINATQPFMITMPHLAAHYGVGRAIGALSKAYRDINTLGVVGRGLRDTATKSRHPSEVPTDPVSTIMSRLTNKREVDMLNHMIEFGVLDTDAGLEVSQLMRERRGVLGKMDGGISYLEGIARQMPKAVEAINRTTTALAAYRLEMQRSGDHAKAVSFAYDTISRTQFNYSHTNAAPYMNHPFLRLATQFKKFGVGMYSHLGEQMGIAVDRTSTPQERAAAIKSLGYTIGMHVLIAGAMGLPTEPIKMVITGMNAMGVTDLTWNDVEMWQREALADLFGKDVGEALSRGLPRMAGVDLSTRMGIDTLMGPFGEPRSNEAQDLKAYLWEAVMGAPAGLVFDMTGGVGDLVNGDVMRAMEKLVPIKAFSDTLKAYRQMTEGTVSQSSGRQIMSEYSFGEAALRSFGFTPAREAEAFERSNMFYRARDAQVQARGDLQREWSQASGAARGRIWREIQNWNRSQPRDVRITLTDLRRYRARMLEDIRQTNEGLRARRQEQHLLDRADRTFNFEP